MAAGVKVQQMVTSLVEAERRVQELDRKSIDTGMVSERQWERAKRNLSLSVMRLQRAVAR